MRATLGDLPILQVLPLCSDSIEEGFLKSSFFNGSNSVRVVTAAALDNIQILQVLPLCSDGIEEWLFFNGSITDTVSVWV